MKQIKTLRFFIWHLGIKRPEFLDRIERCTPLTSIEEIDKQVNKTLADLQEKESAIIQDIVINDTTILRHNNGGDDTIMRTYTIYYDRR